MNKLSLDALRERAEAVASEDLLATISGGTQNACHDKPGNEEDSILYQEKKDIPEPNTTFPTPQQPAPDRVIIRL